MIMRSVHNRMQRNENPLLMLLSLLILIGLATFLIVTFSIVNYRKDFKR